jgi:peptidyl-prolyl cis-trans isomerase A (cyclophilin A)
LRFAGDHLSITPMKRRSAFLAIVLRPFLACAQEKKATPAPAATPTPETKAAPTKAAKVRFKTDQGEFVVELNAAKAPVSVENFLGYVKKKHFDGTVFHRIMADFMIQGGGFTLDNGSLVQKSTDKPIKNECQNGLKNDRGTIAMARTPVLDSATCQFFINVVDNPMLNYPSNGGYAVFGKVVEGMAVVDKIKAMDTKMAPGSSEKSVPVNPVVITSATLVE